MSLFGNSDKFQIVLTKPDNSKKTLTFSEKFQNFDIYTEEFWKTPAGDGRSRGGKLLQKFKWVLYYIEIDWEAYSSDEDTKKVAEVLNAEIQGTKIEIRPSLDIPSLLIEVSQLKSEGSAGKKKLTPWLRETGSEGNKGLRLTYVSVNSHPDISWPDPLDVIGLITTGGEEYIFA